MPPRARRIPPPIPCSMLLPPAQAPGQQQHPFHVPVDSSSQHHRDVAGMGMNIPPVYAQPYGAPPYPLFHQSQFTAYPGVGNAPVQPWGYGHYTPGPVPHPVLNPLAVQLDHTRGAIAHEAQGHAAAASEVEVMGIGARTEVGGIVNADKKGRARPTVDQRTSQQGRYIVFSCRKCSPLMLKSVGVPCSCR
jgi:hypothetical protein